MAAAHHQRHTPVDMSYDQAQQLVAFCVAQRVTFACISKQPEPMRALFQKKINQGCLTEEVELSLLGESRCQNRKNSGEVGLIHADSLMLSIRDSLAPRMWRRSTSTRAFSSRRSIALTISSCSACSCLRRRFHPAARACRRAMVRCAF